MNFLLLVLSVFCSRCWCTETTIDKASNQTIWVGQLHSDYVINTTSSNNGSLTIAPTNSSQQITLRCHDDGDDVTIRNLGLVASCTRQHYVIELRRPVARTLQGIVMTWRDDVSGDDGKKWTLLFRGNRFDAVFDLDRVDLGTTAAVSIPNGATYAFTRCINSSDVITMKEDGGGNSWRIYESKFVKCGEVNSSVVTLYCRLVASRVCPGGEMLVVEMTIPIRDQQVMTWEFVDGGGKVIRRFNVTESIRNVRVQLSGPIHIYKKQDAPFVCNLTRGKASLRIMDGNRVVLAETSSQTSLTFTTKFDNNTILLCEATQENGQIVVAKSPLIKVTVYDPPHWKVRNEVCNLTTNGLGICKKTIIANPPALRGYLYNGANYIERVDICSGVNNEQSFKLSKMQQFDPNHNYTLKLQTLIGYSDLDLHIVVRSQYTTTGPVEVPVVFLVILGVIICLQLALICICFIRKQKYKKLVKEMSDDGTISYPRIMVNSASRDSSAASQITRLSRNASGKSEVGCGGVQSQRSSVCTFNNEDKRHSVRNSKGNIKYIPPSDYILPETYHDSETEVKEKSSHDNAAARKDAISTTAVTTASSAKPVDRKRRFRRKPEEKRKKSQESENEAMVIEDERPEQNLQVSSSLTDTSSGSCVTPTMEQGSENYERMVQH